MARVLGRSLMVTTATFRFCPQWIEERVMRAGSVAVGEKERPNLDPAVSALIGGGVHRRRAAATWVWSDTLTLRLPGADVRR
jgi:hypothetical protein